MRRYLIAYGVWLAGVLAAATVAYYYYRRVLAIGEAELAEQNGRRSDGPAGRRREPVPETAEPVEPPRAPGSDGDDTRRLTEAGGELDATAG